MAAISCTFVNAVEGGGGAAATGLGDGEGLGTEPARVSGQGRVF